MLKDSCDAHDKRESGQALVEYGLILGLISVAVIVALTAMAGGVDGMYNVIEAAATAMADAVANN